MPVQDRMQPVLGLRGGADAIVALGDQVPPVAHGLIGHPYAPQEPGNVLTIADANAGGTQTQTFTYDSLDRLVTAAAVGGWSSNIHFRPGEFNFLREARDHGVPAALDAAAAHFGAP